MLESAKIFDDIVRGRRAMRIYDHEKEFDASAVQRSLQRALLAPNSSNMQLWEFYRVADPEKIKSIAKLCMNQNSARTAKELIIIAIPSNKWRLRAKANLKFHHARYQNKPVKELSKREQRKLSYYSRLMPVYYFQDWFGIWGMIRKLIVFIASFFRPVVWQVSKNDLRIISHKSAALAAQTFMLSMKSEGYDCCPMEGFDSWKLKRYLKFPLGYEINMIISCGPGTDGGIYHERFRVPEEEVLFNL
ncbi:MAG: nitroreductase family protein [Chitinophagales bacterium]